MSQRIKSYPNTTNLETIACEKYLTKLMQREKLHMQPKCSGGVVTTQKIKEKVIKQPQVTSAMQNQLSKIRSNVKQQNISPLTPVQSQTSNESQFAEDQSALVQVTVKTANPRQRSRSTVASREPWGQLLKQQKSNDKVSIFNNFDPLRTLHFLAKELQYQLQTILPDDGTVQQMVSDMQNALKRVPPEIASAVHLQQAMELLPMKKSSRSMHDEKPEKLNKNLSEKTVQTLPTAEQKECERLQNIMADSTVKLEASCKQMETLCEKLKNEKDNLEKQLEKEQSNVIHLKKKVEDLEFEKNDILNLKLKKLQDEKRKLTSEMDKLKTLINTQSTEPPPELKALIVDLENANAAMEQECTNLKHQLRLTTIEKEKYIAVLAVRDRQINEIRTEMTQLQEVVNEQLMELHNNAFQKMPSNYNLGVNASQPWNIDHNKEIGETGDGTLSTINTNDDVMQPQHSSFRDLPSGDKCSSSKLHQEGPDNNYYESNVPHSERPKSADVHAYLDRPDSQVSIRSMFNELKKTAYAIGTSSQKANQHTVNSNRQ